MLIIFLILKCFFLNKLTIFTSFILILIDHIYRIVVYFRIIVNYILSEDDQEFFHTQN